MEDKFKKTEYYLYKYKDISILNQINDIKIKQLQNDISIKGISYDEKSTPTNKFNSDVENEVMRREAHIKSRIEELEKEKADRLNEKEIIEKSLELLSPEERKLIQLRYFTRDKLSWTSIAMNLNVSIDSCIRLRREAINRISKCFN